jgi:coenzyme F420-dependent oxidoreductase
MTDRDVFLPVGAQPSIDALCEQAKRAEELGYHRVWLPETWGRDAVTVLTSIAHRTDDIGIGSSILPIYSRSPVLVGQTAATLQEVSDGRFRLGLGPSGPIVIENWHGVDYGNPLRRTRETVEIVKRVLAGEEVEYDGEYFDLSGFRLRCEPPETPPAVDAAGMGPKAVELAGRFADGWHALMLTRDGIRDRLADLRRGADLAGRDPEDVRVTLSLTCAALEDGERARQSVRQHLAFYVGGMGTFYQDSLAAAATRKRPRKSMSAGRPATGRPRWRPSTTTCSMPSRSPTRPSKPASDSSASPQSTASKGFRCRSRGTRAVRKSMRPPRRSRPERSGESRTSTQRENQSASTGSWTAR